MREYCYEWGIVTILEGIGCVGEFQFSAEPDKCSGVGDIVSGSEKVIDFWVYFCICKRVLVGS